MVVKGLPAGPETHGQAPVTRRPSFASSHYSIDSCPVAPFLGEVHAPPPFSLRGTDASVGSGSATGKKKKSAWKSVGKFLKGAVGAQFDAGLESFCDVCRCKMVPDKDKQRKRLVCPECP